MVDMVIMGLAWADCLHGESNALMLAVGAFEQTLYMVFPLYHASGWDTGEKTE